jgi:TPP-dependent pyruvate/acetoin dehydrogenase alpha subunit
MKMIPNATSELPTDLLWRLYRSMVLIRVTEERIAELVTAGEIKTPCHLYIGQEAIAAGVCATLGKEDYVWGGHRSHGHYLAKGGELNAMMAEIFGKATGCSRGRGGSMHLCAPEVGVLGTVPLVAATIPLAVGAAMAAKMRGDRQVSVAFFGDGAVEEGHFHESANLAALYRLPVVFVCENNWYSSHMHISQRRAKDNIDEAALVHGLSGKRVDGNDAEAVFLAAVEAVESARESKGPTLLEFRTFRWRGHVGPSWDMDVGIKRRGELKNWVEKDPIVRLRARLEAAGAADDQFIAAKHACEQAVEESILFARQSPWPQPAEAHQHVFYGE